METRIVGLTGPIAAGKDAVAKILQRRGAFVIDVDNVAHTLYEPQSEVWREIVRAFGSKVLNRGGGINRKKLGEIVFGDKRKLTELNQIIHPKLKEAIEHRTRNTEHGAQDVFINAALLKEIGLFDLVDEVWVVTASRENRLKRLLKTGLSKKAALQRINSQLPMKEYLAMADVVIENNGTPRQLNAKIQTHF